MSQGRGGTAVAKGEIPLLNEVPTHPLRSRLRERTAAAIVLAVSRTRHQHALGTAHVGAAAVLPVP